MSCPRASTREAFAGLAASAFARGSAEGEQAGALSRVLLTLLDDDAPGSAKWMSPGGVTHIAEVVAAGAEAVAASRAVGGKGIPEGPCVLNAGGAIPRLLKCLRARHSHETSAQPRSPSGGTPPPPRIQDVAGFAAVLGAITRLLAAVTQAPAGGVERRVEEALGADGVAALTDRQFLAAALQACPSETGDLLANLVWDSSSEGPVSEAGDAGSGDVGSAGAGGGQGRPGERDVGISAGPADVRLRALAALVDMALDASRTARPGTGAGVPPGSSQAQATGGACGSAASVELGTCIGALARVLHLRDGGGRIKDRLDATLTRLAVAARESEGDRGGDGCGGALYLTSRLVVSLFVHLPEARSVLSHPLLILGPARTTD